MESSINQHAMIVTIAPLLTLKVKVTVFWTVNSTNINKCFVWISAIYASVLEGKFQGVREGNVRVMMTHLVTSVKSYKESHSVGPMM